MKRRVLLVDDEIPILLTLKAVLELGGFDVDTATTAGEGKRRIQHREYEMIITDLRMESDAAGAEVIAYARTAAYKPAIALLTAFPIAEEDWQGMGADEMLVKPMQMQVLLGQIEALLVAHQDKKMKAAASLPAAAKKPKKAAKKKTIAKKAVAKKAAKKAPQKATARRVPKKSARPAKKAAKKKALQKKTAKKKSVRKKKR